MVIIETFNPAKTRTGDTSPACSIALNDDLPANFVLIHRSFIVNSDIINSYNYEVLRIGEKELTISRSYKKKIMDEMKKQNKKSLS